MAALTIDFAELEYAVGDASGHAEHAWYLDTQTGDLFLVTAETDDEGLPAPRERLAKGGAFLRVEPRAPEDGVRDREEFLSTVRDAVLRDRLAAALASKAALRLFKDALLEAPGDRDRWLAFERERVRAHVRAWLASRGIEAKPR